MPWIGSSLESENVRQQIAQLRTENGPILIEGETGTGKEITARLLHENMDGSPFMAVNCASFSEGLFETELFGYERGSFTGAFTTKEGLIQASANGDLFLDEIDSLTPTQQGKLLRFIESGEVRKLGSKNISYSPVRIITASNKNLMKLVSENKFREDLYFRISTQKICLPPLRDRLEDIPELCDYFIRLGSPKHNKTWELGAFELLKSYSWPGNVRELKQLCNRLLVHSPLPLIRTKDIKKFLFIQTHSPVESSYASELSLEEFKIKQENLYLQSVLKSCRSLDEAVSRLKISKSNLYKKIKLHGIKYETYRWS